MIFSTDSQSPKIRVQLVDSEQASQQRVKEVLQSSDDALLIGCSSGFEETFQDIRSEKPQLVLLDLLLPERGAARVTKQLRQEQPDIGIIVLTLHDEKQCLLEYLSLGARGFLLKPVEPDALLTAVREVHRGSRFVDPLLPHCLVSHYVDGPSPPRNADPSKVEILTVREREVCRYLASGYTNAEVADALRISKRTVETHRAAIMSKVGVRSRAQLVHFAIEHGLWPGADPSQDPHARHLTVTPGE
jgi:two-component system response regulator NreC